MNKVFHYFLINLNKLYFSATYALYDKEYDTALKYYEALNQANNGNYQKLILLMCQAVERTLNIYLSLLPDNDTEYQLISDIVNEPESPYGQEYISLLARQGKIDAYKEGKNWLTTKKAIEEYMQNRKRKR